MRRYPEPALRGVLFIIYFVIAYVVLFFFFRDDPFCARPGARNYLLVACGLALALASYDFAVSLVVATVLNGAARILRMRWLGPPVIALVVGLGVGYLPFWIYKGYGHFRFEGTWADASCFFTEGYGLTFPFVLAPLFALLSLTREISMLQLRREQPVRHNIRMHSKSG